MNKKVKIALLVGALAIAAYLAYRWYQNKQSGGLTGDQSSPTGGFGSNLNSVAPELVGGSTGPAIGPALSAPVNITLTEQVAPSPQDIGSTMKGVNTSSTNAVKAQNASAKNAGSQPDKTTAMNNDIGAVTPKEGSVPVGGEPKPMAGAPKPRRVEPAPVKRTNTPMKDEG